MDRRKSLKLIATGVVAVPTVIAGCANDDKKKTETIAAGEPKFALDRNPDELKREKELLAQEKFFTDHEMATLTVLGDIIIPKDDVSGSASEAKVPEFIEFIVKDMPAHQVPMKGGLRWIDMYCLKKHEKAFKDCTHDQQIALVDQIAYPENAKKNKDLAPGVSFFTLMRNLTATGFYTSAIGVKDVGYLGNTPNKWDGVPQDVLQKYGLTYTEKDLAECVKFDA